MRSSHIAIFRCAVAVAVSFLLTTHAIAEPPQAASVRKTEPNVSVEKTLVRYRIHHLSALRLVQNLERLGLFNPRDLRITIDERRQEIMAYGPAEEHAKFEKAIEMLDLDHPEEQDRNVQARRERVHVVPIGELPSDVLKTITSLYKNEFESLTFLGGLMIAEGAEKDVDAIMELVGRIERIHHDAESRHRREHQSGDAVDTISLRLLCLIENGGHTLPDVEEPLAAELAKLGYGQLAKVTELRTSSSLNEIAIQEEFGVAGQIGDALLESEFRILHHDGTRNFLFSAEVAMMQDPDDDQSSIFQTRTTVQLSLGQWAVIAAAPAPDMKGDSNGVSQSRVILLLRADSVQRIGAK